jgi:glycosyltransferase involved in cell wall biosynthesis
MVNNCSWITAPSLEICEKTVALGFPEDRVTYIPNGVDSQRFYAASPGAQRKLSFGRRTIRFPPGVCVVICARRFGRKNGLHVFLDALESLSPRMLSRCVFVFAGYSPELEGAYGREIARRIKVLSEKAVCHVLGPVPNDLMPEVYRVADISVLPSLIEATSLTGLESMASGLPIVGTDVGGIPEIVEDGLNGLLCRPNDSAALAKNLEELVGNAELRNRLGMAARKTVVERFSWDRVAGQFLDVYRRALNQRSFE